MHGIKKAIQDMKDEQFKRVILPLAEKYGIENATALEKLYTELEIISSYGSEVRVSGKKVAMAEGETTLAKTKALTGSTTKAASRLYDYLNRIGVEPVALFLMSELGYADRYIKAASALQENIEELCIILDKVKELKTNGRPRRKDWSYQAVELCKRFWKEEMYKTPHIYFVEKNPETPKNEFTQWFCDIMKSATGTSRTKCKTFLED